jgi:hypothetical protein
MDLIRELIDETSNTVLLSNDDSGYIGDSLAFMFRRELAAGDYFIRVAGASQNEAGAYTLFLRTISEPGSTTSTAHDPKLWTADTGNLSSEGDIDYFKLEIDSTRYVFVYFISFDIAFDIDVSLTKDSSDHSAFVVPHASWVELGRPEVSAYLWAEMEPGTYYLKAEPASGSTCGAYLVQVRLHLSYAHMIDTCTAASTMQSDPLFGCRWHLNNSNQLGAGGGQDINVESVWAAGNKGDGIHTAVSNNSWGNPDGDHPKPVPTVWETAIEQGLTSGFEGKGIVYVWAVRNGHLRGDNSNLGGHSNFYGVTAACAVNYDDKRSSYSEQCANLWVCAPSNDSRESLPGITTTRHGGSRYRADFGGTPSAAPIVSGVIALIRRENDALTWRDVKLILAGSARKNDSRNSGWEGGSGSYSFNHEYGFGVVDAVAAVELAKTWSNVPTMRTIEVMDTPDQSIDIPDAIVDGRIGRVIERTLTIDSHVQFVEFVELKLEVDHPSFRDVAISLFSPSGRRSVIVPAIKLTTSDGLFTPHPLTKSFRFGSARHLGENATEEWQNGD